MSAGFNTLGQIWNECRQAVRRERLPRPRPSERTAPLLRQLQHDGFALLPNFLPRERCQQLIGKIDAALERYRDFLQLDELRTDERLFGLDAFDDEVRQLAFDPLALEVLKQYQRTESYEGFALCARLTAQPGNKGSGQGWHRDSAAFEQVKLMVYLNDVGEDGGPFQYIRGSHRPLDVVRCTARFGFATNQFRYSDEEIARVLDDDSSRLRTFTARAGTALLFDSRGLHRGKPIVAGRRYAITTYLWFDMPAASHIKAWTIASQQANGPMRR